MSRIHVSDVSPDLLRVRFHGPLLVILQLILPGHSLQTGNGSLPQKYSKQSNIQKYTNILRVESSSLPQIFDGPVCGNGFTEPGEECDCAGSRDTCPCCDPVTCTLTPGATCGAGSCCDQDTCGLRGAGEVCRHVQGECDLEETCDGVTHTCPRDVHKVKTSLMIY